MLRASLAFLVFCLSTTAATAQEPEAPKTTTPLIATLLPYLEDENLGMDLKLTPEQVKKLVALRQSFDDAQYTTAPAEFAKGLDARRQALVALFKEVLSADQHKRALQLAAQKAWGFQAQGRAGVMPKADLTKVTRSVLTQYPVIAEALKLTDEQKKLTVKLSGLAGSLANSQMVFLTPEQSKAAETLLGEPAKGTWKPAVGRRNTGATPKEGFAGMRGFATTPRALLQNKNVRDEIALTEEQYQALTPTLEKWSTIASDTRSVSPEQRAKENAELTAETEKALAATLKPEQATRLRQIGLQRQLSPLFGFGGLGGSSEMPPLSAQLRHPEIQKALTITPDQEKAFQAAEKTHDDAITAAVTADKSVDDAKTAIAAAQAAQEKAYASALTEAQKKTLGEMLGKHFAGNTRTPPFGKGGGFAPPGKGGGSAQSSDFVKTFRTANFGRRIPAEISLLAQNKAIQTELKLTPEQIQKAAAASTETKGLGMVVGGAGEKATIEDLLKVNAQASAAIAKVLEGILTADQAKRHRELMLQRAEFFKKQPAKTGSTTSMGAIAYAGVAEAVKLTDAQKAKILDGEKSETVLTADQKAAIQAMLGKPFAGDFSIRTGLIPGGGSGLGNRPAGSLPTVSEVLLNVPWEVFKFSPEQVAKLAPVMNQYQADGGARRAPTGGGFKSLATTPEKRTAAEETLMKALATILTSDQTRRVEQVRYQILANSGLSYLQNAEVAKALQIHEDQLAKIGVILDNDLQLQSAARGPASVFASPTPVVGGGRAFEWRAKLTEATNAQVQAVLTDEQKSAWRKLTGDPVPNLPWINQVGGPGGGGFGAGFGS